MGLPQEVTRIFLFSTRPGNRVHTLATVRQTERVRRERVAMAVTWVMGIGGYLSDV